MITQKRHLIIGFIFLAMFLLPVFSIPVNAQEDANALGVSVPAIPAEAGGDVVYEPEPSFITSIPSNFIKGVKVVLETIVGWFKSIGEYFNLGKGEFSEGAACDSTSQCGKDLLCLNSCSTGSDCDSYEKSCVKGSAAVVVEYKNSGKLIIQAEYSECGADDLCANDTICTRTCPRGSECAVTHRCLNVGLELGSCSQNTDCIEACSGRPFAPIGVSAYKPVCKNNQCSCAVLEVDPDLKLTRCEIDFSGQPLICPTGTNVACSINTSGENFQTCLTAPEFGGQCLGDNACSNVACATGTTPFCDEDQRCRCKHQEVITISCADASECSDQNCAEGQISACTDGACTCATSVQKQEDASSCAQASDCNVTCPPGFHSECIDNACACSKTTENVPVACTAVEECSTVSCPDDFEKACLNNQCACTRETT